MPKNNCTYKPVYEQPTRQVGQTCYSTERGTRERVCKTYTCEPVWTDKCEKLCTGEWKEERQYCPGPVVTKCCKTPGKCVFDPCTCTTRYCPGESVSYQVQCPGSWTCKRIWCPREEVRTVRCCHYERREHCKTVNYTVCKV